MRINRVSTTIFLLLSLAIHVLDEATDFFAAFLLLAENDLMSGALTLLFIFLPGLFIFVNETKRSCLGKSNLCKAFGYLIFCPLWGIVIHLYSVFDERYVSTAFFFKTIEGFLEASPQLLLQLSLLFRGSWSQSSQAVVSKIILDDTESSNSTALAELEVFGRVYGSEERHWFGVVHVLSVGFSFISVLFSSIFFNDIEPNHRNVVSREEDIPPMWPIVCNKKICAKLLISIPFFFCTLIYRAVGLAIVICFAKFWGGVIIFWLFFINLLSALFIGDDISRSFFYAVWSLLIPVGYNRNPRSPMGYSKLPLIFSLSPSDDHELLSDRDIELFNNRAKHFLTAHMLTSMIILGPAILITLILVQTYPEYYELNSQAVFNLSYLNTVFLPLLGLSLGFSMFLARPYHRCECSDNEMPKGNVIV